MSDAEPYRTKDEVNHFKEDDPIGMVERKIIENEWATKEQLDEVMENVIKKVQECVEFAENSPYPDAEQMYSTVYEQEDYPFLDKI